VDAPNNFWLALHQLSKHYLAEGATPQERADAIAQQFAAMPAIARRELLSDLWPLSVSIPIVYTMLLSVHRTAELREGAKEKAG
jgi:hypothetical protein